MVHGSETSAQDYSTADWAAGIVQGRFAATPDERTYLDLAATARAIAQLPVAISLLVAFPSAAPLSTTALGPAAVRAIRAIPQEEEERVYGLVVRSSHSPDTIKSANTIKFTTMLFLAIPDLSDLARVRKLSGIIMVQDDESCVETATKTPARVILDKLLSLWQQAENGSSKHSPLNKLVDSSVRDVAEHFAAATENPLLDTPADVIDAFQKLSLVP